MDVLEGLAYLVVHVVDFPKSGRYDPMFLVQTGI